MTTKQPKAISVQPTPNKNKQKLTWSYRVDLLNNEQLQLPENSKVLTIKLSTNNRFKVYTLEDNIKERYNKVTNLNYFVIQTGKVFDEDNIRGKKYLTTIISDYESYNVFIGKDFML